MNDRTASHRVVPLLVAALCVALLTSCSNSPHVAPTPVATFGGPVGSPPVVGESGPVEGWVGDDELTDTDVPAATPVDPHTHDPPSDAQMAAAVTTAAQVIEGWLTTDQDQRRQLLDGVAAEALIASFDDPRFAPVAERQQGPTHVVVADQMQIITRHRLDTGDVVEVTLIHDRDGVLGWAAIGIGRG